MIYRSEAPIQILSRLLRESRAPSVISRMTRATGLVDSTRNGAS